MDHGASLLLFLQLWGAKVGKMNTSAAQVGNDGQAATRKPIFLFIKNPA
ncbi:hypothetical protein CZ787_09705 [Halomonas citrativorans]|uniref:Uncharacterized protein n=1 Tax=Halomonas citrativorans TaxID=2742612 RepID=A0A1R4I015_9GAMM|nr:hypothetical protein CZ787_09705 [Halomonas citrativorans]